MTTKKEEVQSLKHEVFDNKYEEISDSIKYYPILRVDKLLAAFPVYIAARTDTPRQGEIWISDISGTRKINVFISGTIYSITVT